MRAFVELFNALDNTTSTKAKADALSVFFGQSPAADCAWALHLFSGGKPPYRVPSKSIRMAAAQASGYPDWLVEESYAMVGDLAETCALLAPKSQHPIQRSLSNWIDEIGHLRSLEEASRTLRIIDLWAEVADEQRFVLNKLMTGGFRVGVARGILARGLAQVLDRTPEQVQSQLMGGFEPTEAAWSALINNDLRFIGQPYPFFLASPLEDVNELGASSDFQAEYKWDGIRAQLVKRGQHVSLWSRGEELINDTFPDVIEVAHKLTIDLVIDAELIVYKDHTIGSFNDLQQRLGRKKVSKKTLQALPCTLMCYDLLEYKGQDQRMAPLRQRRRLLEKLDLPFLRSQLLDNVSWDALTQQRQHARDIGAEGLMLKRQDSPYRVGRKKGDWFKWKLDPMSLDVVLMYAQAGHGNRANLYSDYTLGVWKGDELVPIGKAYSGLDRDEMNQIDRWIKQHTLDRFGPVRSVPPELVFELGFEGIGPSPRHKSGVALRFPRILRWRQDKPAIEANRIEDALALIQGLIRV